MCQKWELGIQSFYYSSQTYSMQVLKKMCFGYIKPVLYTFQEGYFFLNFILKNWLLKVETRKSTFFILKIIVLFLFSFIQKCFAFWSKPIETDNCKIKYNFICYFYIVNYAIVVF